MPLRFQKRIRLFKGLTINLSKTGTSVSIGGRGATVNLSKRGTRTTVGIPGTGISYSQTSKPVRMDSTHKTDKSNNVGIASAEAPSNQARSSTIWLLFLIFLVGLVILAMIK